MVWIRKKIQKHVMKDDDVLESVCEEFEVEELFLEKASRGCFSNRGICTYTPTPTMVTASSCGHEKEEGTKGAQKKE